jgi:predicted alpha/beta-fold hydrolase
MNKAKSSNPLVLIVPGLTGDSTKLYMISTIKAAMEQEYDAIVINYRGLAGVPLKVRFIVKNL